MDNFVVSGIEGLTGYCEYTWETDSIIKTIEKKHCDKVFISKLFKIVRNIYFMIRLNSGFIQSTNIFSIVAFRLILESHGKISKHPVSIAEY